MLLQTLAFAAAIAPTLADSDKVYKHVAAFSIDGLHSSDVEKYVAKRTGSTIATLLKTAYEYTDCYTSAPSDSYPGVAAFVSGADPRTTGIWYDDVWDRSFWDPYSVSGKNCSGPPVTYDETKDYDWTKLWSGGIDPANLPQSMIGGKCTWTYPHQRIRVNTIYEIVEASGKQTAYADKHPSYDMVRGPSGKGLSVGYFPEIQSFDTTNVTQIIGYDQMHVDAFLAWINGTTPVNSEVQDKLTGIPTLFGGNFQAVSVAEKSYGYVAGSLDFTPELLRALDFVDTSLGKVVTALKAKGIYDDTLIIVASKHGQAPIDPTKYGKVDPSLLAPAMKVPVSFITTDDIGLVYLADARDTDTAVDNLNGQRDTLRISDIISGDRLIYEGYGDPTKDPAVPNIIIKPDLGIIYTTSTAKIAEHGGISDDDRKVACFASASNLQKTVYDHQVHTKEFAPAILKALGLDPMALQGVVAEGGKVIDGFSN
ncbi:type I phosphodiesterase/nucleotide pyrophosphatase [Acephala macrosclerotiorum]|nr:type I phosphodiesterase/nucleotide pyrophosphatase [Acephala macrosclerotiorum]